MSDPANLLADVVNLGFAWVKARSDYRKIEDSKSSTADARKKAGMAALEAASKLEKALLRLMSASGGKPARRKGTPSQVDWGRVAGAIAKGAGALEDVLKGGKGPYVEVIDTEGSEVR